MQKALMTILCVFSLALAGCSYMPFVYKPEVQQGNVITTTMVKELKIGMSKQEVANIMGTPVLSDTFRADRWDYVYTDKPSWGRLQERRLTLYFKKDRLARIGS